MLRKKVKISLLFFLVILISIMCIQSFRTHIQNQNESQIKLQEQKITEELAIQNQRKLNEEILRAKIVKSNNFVRSISNEIEIILFNENGEYSINHDRTPENNWYSEWLKNAELTIKLDYRTIFTIKTKDIVFTVTPKGIVNISYDSSKIFITAVDISNVLPSQKVGLLGSKYEPIEVAALENIAKEDVKNLSYSDANILKASDNLKSYLKDSAKKFEVEEINIIDDNKDINIDVANERS